MSDTSTAAPTTYTAQDMREAFVAGAQWQRQRTHGHGVISFEGDSAVAAWRHTPDPKPARRLREEPDPHPPNAAKWRWNDRLEVRRWLGTRWEAVMASPITYEPTYEPTASRIALWADLASKPWTDGEQHYATQDGEE